MNTIFNGDTHSKSVYKNKVKRGFCWFYKEDVMSIIELWLHNKIYHKEIADYLINELGISTVAIYGAAQLGELLYDDLLDKKGIEVRYFIDRAADELYYGIDDMEIFSLKELDSVPIVDAIIVTPYQYMDSIAEVLRNKLPFNTQILSLEDIICRVE